MRFFQKSAVAIVALVLIFTGLYFPKDLGNATGDLLQVGLGAGLLISIFTTRQVFALLIVSLGSTLGISIGRVLDTLIAQTHFSIERYAAERGLVFLCIAGIIAEISFEKER